MLTLAIDQDQRLIEPETTEAGEVDGIRTIATTLLIIIEGWNRHIQLGHQVGFGGCLPDAVDVDDIDRYRRLRTTAGRATTTDKDHLCQLGRQRHQGDGDKRTIRRRHLEWAVTNIAYY